MVATLTVRTKIAKSSSKTHATSDWQFVNLGQSKKGNGPDVRKLVRQNAMRDYRRKEKDRLAAACSETLGDQGDQPMDPCSTAASMDPVTIEPFFSFEDISEWLQESSTEWPSNIDESAIDYEAVVATGQNLTPSYNQQSHRRVRQTSFKGLRKRLSIATNPLVMIGSGNRDPFNACPTFDRSNHTELLEHCQPSRSLLVFNR